MKTDSPNPVRRGKLWRKEHAGILFVLGGLAVSVVSGVGILVIITVTQSGLKLPQQCIENAGVWTAHLDRQSDRWTAPGGGLTIDLKGITTAPWAVLGLTGWTGPPVSMPRGGNLVVSANGCEYELYVDDIEVTGNNLVSLTVFSPSRQHAMR